MSVDAIIFAHQGANRYLPLALLQAQHTNPRTRIVLLGDAGNRGCPPGIEHHEAWTPDARTAALRDTYVHLSTNPAEAELACLARWFILADFCRTEKLKSVLYLDSDVMVFADMQRSAERFARHAFTLSAASCGHASFWNDMAALEAFCGFVVASYQRARADGLVPTLARHPAVTREELESGVTDMTFLKMFARDNAATVGETTDIVDGATFDHNINLAVNGTRRFQVERGTKLIRISDGRAMGMCLDTGEQVAFDLLHCQGIGKMCMQNLLMQRSPTDWRGIAWERALLHAKRFVPEVIRRSGRGR